MLKPLSAGRWNFAAAAHLLNRAGFGGAPAAVDSLVEMGPAAAVCPRAFITCHKADTTRTRTRRGRTDGS